jgi:hypothetical protein
MDGFEYAYLFERLELVEVWRDVLSRRVRGPRLAFEKSECVQCFACCLKYQNLSFAAQSLIISVFKSCCHMVCMIILVKSGAL